MRILVISDTHGVCDRVYEVYRKLTKQNPVDYIVHCGDYCKDAEEIRMRLGVPVASVRGNCDGGIADTDFSILETEAGNFLITHGHMQNVDLSMQNLYYKALENDGVGALFGHTHRAVYTQTGDVYLMNPGSLSRPRDGSGGTFGLLITDEEGVWGKIYAYDDFMQENDRGGAAAPPTDRKPKVRGGHLRELLNYSDRF